MLRLVSKYLNARLARVSGPLLYKTRCVSVSPPTRPRTSPRSCDHPRRAQTPRSTAARKAHAGAAHRRTPAHLQRVGMKGFHLRMRPRQEVGDCVQSPIRRLTHTRLAIYLIAACTASLLIRPDEVLTVRPEVSKGLIASLPFDTSGRTVKVNTS